MLIPFKALLVFEAVARKHSFTAAADELNVSQSAVSHQIRNLESYFGVKLLDRSGNRVSLTPEGQVLYKDLDAAVSILRIGVRNLKATVSSASIGVSVRSHFAYKWLSPRLCHATFDFDIHFYHTNSKTDFSDPNIYLAIEWLREDQAPSHSRLLVAGNLTPACHPSILQGIANRSDPVILEHFNLLHESDDKTWKEWLTKAGISQLRIMKHSYYSDTNVRQQAAIDKLGFALVCPSLIEDDIKEGRLICPFDVYLETYGYYLIAPPEHMNRPNVRKVVEFIVDHA